MRHLALSLALLAGPAWADDYVARNGADEVRLTEAPCTSPAVLARIPPPLHDTFLAAVTTLSGAQHIACWRKMGDHIHLMYEDGDQGIVARDAFRRQANV